MDNFDFNFNIDVSIWSETLDEKMTIIPGNLSQELKDVLRKEINNIIKSDLEQRN